MNKLNDTSSANLKVLGENELDQVVGGWGHHGGWGGNHGGRRGSNGSGRQSSNGASFQQFSQRGVTIINKGTIIFA